MIVDLVCGDVFKAPVRHIAFAVNTDGMNDAGFAGQVAERFWPSLARTGRKRLGEILARRVSPGLSFHAFVCHSLKDGGWKRTSKIVQQCLDRLDVSPHETIAVVLMGSGEVGRAYGADTQAILGGLARSKKKVAVYVR